MCGFSIGGCPVGWCDGGSPTGTIDIELGGARLRISGAVDTAILRQVLTYLGRKP